VGNTAKDGVPNRQHTTCLDKAKQQLRTKQAKLDHVAIAVAIHQWHCQ